MPTAKDERTLNIIRGKNVVGAATAADIRTLFEHIDALEMFLDDADAMDLFGTEGWRHAIGLE